MYVLGVLALLPIAAVVVMWDTAKRGVGAVSEFTAPYVDPS